MTMERKLKTCKMCYQEIDERARKCPFCQHYQDRFSLIVLHPLFALVPFGLLVVFGWIVFGSMVGSLRPKDLATYQGQVKVKQARMVFGESKEGKTVAVVGVLENAGDIGWKDVQVEVQYFDRQSQLIDTATERQYSKMIRPHDENAFKVAKVMNYPVEKYASYKTFVRYAEDARKIP